MNDKNKEIKKLKKQLEKWNHEYYVLAQPTVSDIEYDRVFDKLKTLSQNENIEIGSDLPIQNQFAEFLHPIPMLSLDKVYDYPALYKWIQKTNSPLFSLEPKIDGVSVSLHYENGNLIRALTRGDGIKGSDITENIKTIATVPKNIQIMETLYIRGEVYMEHKDFETYKKQEDTIYANPRNLSAGILRRINSKEVAKAPIKIFLYQAEKYPIPFKTHQESFKILSDQGFPVPPNIYFIKPSDNITQLIEKIAQNRKSLPFDIDGLVLKVDSTKLRNTLGTTSHHPKWAIAFKFDSPTGITQVLDITIQIGRTGKITPLAHLKPVLINGSTVQKATLHNQEYISTLEIGVGDIVSVSKRGEIIPAIEEVIEKLGETWQIPTHCPSCQTLLIIDGAHTFCHNVQCPEKLKEQLIYFTKTLDIEGLGSSFIEVLYNNFGVTRPQNLWSINYISLGKIPGFGEKKIQNIQTQLLLAQKNTKFSQLLIALGIPDISENTVSLLIKSGYISLKQLQSLTLADILTIKGIGNKTAQRILDTFEPYSTIVLDLLELEKIGFLLEEQTQLTTTQAKKPLLGTLWVITGIFENYKPRDKATQLIIKLGGEIGKSITKMTTHLLYGQDSGSKLNAAKENTDIILVSEKEFINHYIHLTKASENKNDSLF